MDTKATVITIADDSDAVVIIKCGDKSIAVKWIDLFQMLSAAVHTWEMRGL